MSKSCQNNKIEEFQIQKSIQNIVKQKDFKEDQEVNVDVEEKKKFNVLSGENYKLQDWYRRYQNWKYKQTYFNFFKLAIQSLVERENQNIDQSFLKNPQNFAYLYSKFDQKLTKQNFIITRKFEKYNFLKPSTFFVKVVNTSQNDQIIQILCDYGIYEKRYTVWATKQKSFRHTNTLIAFGGMGRIYCDSNLKKTYRVQTDPQIEVVSKCLQYSKLDFQDPLFKAIIAEIFFTDMMSALQIGPKFVRSTGFDFIIFENCVEFQMQKCQKIYPQTFEKELKQNLFSMHLLKTVHSDIKPENCMYSPSFKRNVFIDFGISEFLPFFLGSQILTMFKGTYQYCSEEMKKIISKKNPQLIDLYKNDIEMLEKSLKHMKKSIEFSYSASLIEINFKKSKISSFGDQSQVESQQKLFFIFQEVEQKYLRIQYLLKLKYEFYTYQFKNRASDNLKEILTTLSEQKLNQKNTQFIAKQLVDFIVNELDKVQDCLNLLSAQCKILDISIFDSQLDMRSQGRMKTQQRMNQNLQNVTKKNKKESKLKDNLKLYEIFAKKKVIKQQDLQRILFDQSQLQKFSLEQVFQNFLNYVSFWRSTYKVSIQNKQDVACIVRKFVQKSHQQADFQYLKQKYLPEQEFIRNNCRNLVWIYGFLLSYCMQGGNSRFKTNNLILVLKDCILLNFKYYHFVEKCQVKSIQRLIKQNNPSIIATVIVNKIELVWLLSVSFAIFSQTQIQGLQGNKNLTYSYEQFNLYLNLIDLESQEEKNLMNRIQIIFYEMVPFHLKYFHEKQVLVTEFSMFHNNIQNSQFDPNQGIMQKNQSTVVVKKIIEVIENQFEQLINSTNLLRDQKNYSQDLNQIDLSLYKKAIYCIFFPSTFYKKPEEKPRKQFSIFYFSHTEQYDSALFQFFTKYSHMKQHLSKEIPQFKLLVTQIDRKINCMAISRCILIDLRIKICVVYETNNQLLNLVKLITFNKWATVTVYKSLINGHASFRQFFIFLEQNPDLKKYVIESDFISIIVENIFSMIEVIMKQGNFFKLWTILTQIVYLLVLNQNYINQPELKKIFKKVKQIMNENLPGLYKNYYLIERSLSLTPLIRWQSFKLLHSIQTLKVQINLEKTCSENYFAKVKKIFQIFQSLYQNNQGVMKITPSFGGQSEYKYTFNSILHKSLFLVYLVSIHAIFQIFNQSHYFDKILSQGWENVMYSRQNYQYIFQPTVSQSFYYLFQNIYASENYKMLSQFIFIALKEIMSSKIISTPYQSFNMAFKAAVIACKQKFVIFLQTFFKSIQYPFGKNFHQRLCLCLFYINILGFQEYFGMYPQLWKKLLLLLYNHFEMYPKLEYEPQKLKEQRYHKVILLTIIYLNYLKKDRKRNIYIREFIKKIYSNNQFYGQQVILWIEKFISPGNLNQKNSKSLSIERKKLKYLSNVLLKSSELNKTIHKGINLHKSLKKIFVTKQDTSWFLGFQSTISKTRLEKQLKEKYKIPILYPIFQIHADTLMTLVNFIDAPPNDERFSDYASSQQNSKIYEIKQMQNSLPKVFKKPGLFKSFKHQSKEMSTFIQTLKNSQIYNLCNQITQIARDLIKKQKQWLIESKYKFVMRSKEDQIKCQLKYFSPFSIDNMYYEQKKQKYRQLQIQKFKRQQK